MKEKVISITQSCDSRECNKNFKDQKSDLCEAITTRHTFNIISKEITCVECGKIYKLHK